MSTTRGTSTRREATGPGIDAPPAPDPSPSRPEEPSRHREASDARVEEVRRLFGSSGCSPIPDLSDGVRRRLGLAPGSPGAFALVGCLGAGIRLALALVATALVGRWTGIPWGRWAVVLAFYGFFDAARQTWINPVDAEVGPRIRRVGERMTPLVATIVRGSDLEDLAGFLGRWTRPWIQVALGSLVAALMLGAGWSFAPTGMDQLHVGSVVLLALVLYDFGALMVFGNVLEWAFTARQARYDHDLFWPSPADTPEIRTALQLWNVRALTFWITVNLLLTLVLVPWDSPAVAPLAAGFLVIGYLATIGAALADRASVGRIVERARRQQLGEVRERINRFESRYDLSPQESERLQQLLLLHDRIRDAPASPSTTHPVRHALAGLILPTGVFVITVFGEVSAERFLDALLP